MATVLDVSLLGYFNPIYAVLFVFTLLFAILQKTKALGDSPAINGVVAVAISLLTLVSKTLTQIIVFMIPWFAIVIIFIVLLLLVFMVFGVEEKGFAAAAKNKSLMWAIIGVALVIFLAAIGNTFGQSFLEQGGQETTIDASTGSVATSEFESNIYNTLFNPKVLGMMILFAVAIFAVIFLSGTPE